MDEVYAWGTERIGYMHPTLLAPLDNLQSLYLIVYTPEDNLLVNGKRFFKFTISTYFKTKTSMSI